MSTETLVQTVTALLFEESVYVLPKCVGERLCCDFRHATIADFGARLTQSCRGLASDFTVGSVEMTFAFCVAEKGRRRMETRCDVVNLDAPIKGLCMHLIVR